MGQKIKHRKSFRRNSASCNWDIFSGLSNKEDRTQPYSSAYADTLTHPELSQYLHSVLTSNPPYYSAKARLLYLRERIPKSWQDSKNLNFLARLTETGMLILKTRYVNKPKNPE